MATIDSLDQMTCDDGILDLPQAALLGAQCLASRPDKVTFTKVADDELRIALKAQPRTFWFFLLSMPVGALVMYIGGWLFERWAPHETIPPWASRSFLNLMAIGMLAVGVLMLMVRGMTGPERDVVIEVRPGRLKLDRYVAGDHIVREYGAADILGMLVGDGAITLATRTDEFSIAMFLPTDIQCAVVIVAAFGLWQDSALVGKNLKSRFGAHTAVLYACDANRIAALAEASANPHSP